MLIHPNYTNSVVEDISLDVGDKVTAMISRLLNGRNLTMVWRITRYESALKAPKLQDDKKQVVDNANVVGNDVKTENN